MGSRQRNFGVLCAELGVAMALLATGGCGGGVRAETRLAGVVSQFQRSADDFASARAAIGKQRRAMINDTEESAARSRAATDEMIGIWKLADDKERLRVHAQLVANAQAALDTSVAFDALRAAHEKALDEAGTKVKVRDQQLSATIGALTSLGTAKSFEEMFGFYFNFTKDAMNAVAKLEAEAKQAEATARGDGNRVKSATTQPATRAP